MNKWVFGACAIIIIFLSVAYLVLPSSVDVTVTAKIGANADAATRILRLQKTWDRISPDKKISISEPLINGAKLVLLSNSQPSRGQLIVLPLNDDTCALRWESERAGSPATRNRLANYVQSKTLKNDMSEAIERLRSFCEVDSNLYDFRLANESTTDTSLLATKFINPAYPSTQDIYAHIASLQSAAARLGAAQVSHAMLNVTMNTDSTYRCMVAIPINRIVNQQGEIFFTRMEPGRFITAEVKGGTGTILHAHEMVREYINDHKKLLMALPFEHLVTDRQAQPDTTKWITRLYYPVP